MVKTDIGIITHIDFMSSRIADCKYTASKEKSKALLFVANPQSGSDHVMYLYYRQ